jgi:hypothetical protein
MEPTVDEPDLVRAEKRLKCKLSPYMWATFLRVPFCRSGRNARVTQWTPRTLTVKLSTRVSMSTLAGRSPDTFEVKKSSHRFNSVGNIVAYSGIVDQDV